MCGDGDKGRKNKNDWMVTKCLEDECEDRWVFSCRAEVKSDAKQKCTSTLFMFSHSVISIDHFVGLTCEAAGQGHSCSRYMAYTLTEELHVDTTHLHRPARLLSRVGQKISESIFN